MDKITNSEGQVAIRYMQQVQKLVTVGSEQKQYVFSVRGSVSMAWVDPEHEQQILDIPGGCCGQKIRGIFRYANESDVRRWTNNGGR